MLGAAEALEHLPLLSEAYRKGEVCWGKVRAIHGLVTPETEKEWIEFAAAHRTEEVVRKVTMSPQDWKRHKALKASLEGKPIATAAEVKDVLARPSDPGTNASPSVEVDEKIPVLEPGVDQSQKLPEDQVRQETTTGPSS